MKIGVDGERGGLKCPYMCGLDSNGQILVADARNNKYKVLNPQTRIWRTVFTADDYVIDAKVENGHTVWCNAKINLKWAVTKNLCESRKQRVLFDSNCGTKALYKLDYF